MKHHWSVRTVLERHLIECNLSADGRHLDGPRLIRDCRWSIKQAQHLLDLFGTLDVPWSEMMRLRRGALDLPLGGGQDCLRALDPELDPDGRFRAFNGDCLFWFVEWDKDGALTSEVIHQYGAAANDPASPHYADQAPLFAEEQTRPDWFREEDIRAHLKREYRPGEFAGAWYAK